MTLLCKLGHSLEWSVGGHGEVNPWHIAVIQLEGCDPCCADTAIECNFKHWAFYCPILLIISDHRAKDLLDQAVSPIGSSIHLQMECSGHEEFCSHELLKFTPKGGCKLGVSVQDDGIWDCMKSDNFF